MNVTGLTLGEAILPRIDGKILVWLRTAAIVVCLSLATALAAQLKIEIGAVPITMQTLAVLLSGLLFGSRIGAGSQMAYLVAGLAGVPWFSRGGGISYIMSPTFGYLLGFVAAAYTVGKLVERGWDKNFVGAAAAMAVGSELIYLFGLLWLSKFIPLGSLLAVGLYPFMIGDLLKIMAAGMALPLAWKTIKTKNL